MSDRDNSSALSKTMQFLNKVNELPDSADLYLDTFIMAYESGYKDGLKRKAAEETVA